MNYSSSDCGVIPDIARIKVGITVTLEHLTSCEKGLLSVHFEGFNDLGEGTIWTGEKAERDFLIQSTK